MEAPRPEVLLVDGHSMIFSWPELRLLHQKNTGSARQRLVDLLSRLADNTGRHVVIVFDGKGPKSSSDPEETRVQVFYSKSGQTADSVIERLVAKYAEGFRITVATDDHMERTTVSTFGAEWMSSRELLEAFEVAEAEMEEILKRIRRKW